MTDSTPGAATTGPGSELTDAEKLAALSTYIKVLTEMEKKLRAEVTSDFGKRRVEKVGAYLPDGTKLASVSRSDGAKTARVTDEAAALKWCLDRHPEHVYTVQAIRPAYLKVLLEAAAAGEVGEPGVDPSTGEMLPFIKVQRGNPYVSITITDDGRDRMTALASGFAGMLGAAPSPKNGAYR